MLAAAVAAFLVNGPLPEGYAGAAAGSYRALCLAGAQVANAVGAGYVPGVAPAASAVLLLAGEEGAVYVPEHGAAGQTSETSVGEVVAALRYRRTTTTLALRMPPDLGGQAQVFTLWASPKYLAAGYAVEQPWK
jgi:hypothetical protein